METVPNFSEGRDAAVLERLRAALSEVPGVFLLDHSADADHNRSVFTLAGAPEPLVEALLSAAAVAVESIDLRRHRGAHPRIGALDVAPFIPLRGGAWADCLAAAEAFADELWARLGVPSYFYGRAARREERRRLEAVRQGGFEGLLEAAPRDPARRPDVGGPRLHPSAGATAVGVRDFLIAFNVNLRTAEPAPARRIARLIRESSGGYPAVKALGLELPGQGLTQVSMNLTDFRRTGLAVVVERIRREAALDGVECAGSELIGLAPRAAFEGASFEELLLPPSTAERILERRLEAAGAPAGSLD
ncbi:MAG: glutamate formimidoyltransferase [Acidobacteria bacterium]|nr:glutamate formimidoyltransferase [Acidobacteriota bacterium]